MGLQLPTSLEVFRYTSICQLLWFTKKNYYKIYKNSKKFNSLAEIFLQNHKTLHFLTAKPGERFITNRISIVSISRGV